MHATTNRSDLLERATQLRGHIEGRIYEAESQRRLPVETITDFSDAGFFSVLVPKRFGGYELPLDVLLDLVIEVGEVCGSSAWRGSRQNSG